MKVSGRFSFIIIQTCSESSRIDQYHSYSKILLDYERLRMISNDSEHSKFIQSFRKLIESSKFKVESFRVITLKKINLIILIIAKIDLFDYLIRTQHLNLVNKILKYHSLGQLLFQNFSQNLCFCLLIIRNFHLLLNQFLDNSFEWQILIIIVYFDKINKWSRLQCH